MAKRKKTLAKCSLANSAKSSCSSIHKTTAAKKKKKSISNTKRAVAAAAVIISNGQGNFNRISKGKRMLKEIQITWTLIGSLYDFVAENSLKVSSVTAYEDMTLDRKKVKGQQKKKSVANTEKANPFNQTIISNGESVTQKLNHISRGKNILEPSNDNIDQMDVDRMKHLNCAKNDQGSQKLLISKRCPKYHIYSMYCCPLSPVQLVEDVEKLKLDCPSNPKPSHCAIHCCCDGLAIIEVSVFLDHDNFTHLLWNPSTRESIVLPPTECPLVSLSRFGLGYDSINAFHWVTISSNYFEVVSFNISNEVYEEIPLSEEILSLRPDSRGIGVCVLGGMLCVYSNTSLPSPGNDIFKIWALKEYGVKGSWMLLLTVEEPDLYLNAKPTYLFADGEVLFRCMSYQHIGHTFRTLNGPFRSWPICDTMQGGSAFIESLISPKSLTY
ncbi:hypothetical protein BC332_34376 [Capsicum chinense]|nr:hypothetical protein BC332_34376 [Capsicum chinense]